MKKLKVYLIVVFVLLALTLAFLVYVWFTIQLYHNKTKEAERDAYAPIPVLEIEKPVPDA